MCNVHYVEFVYLSVIFNFIVVRNTSKKWKYWGKLVFA